MKLTWKSFEDFSAIVVDQGMVDDHLPTAVTAGLRRIKKQFVARRYDPKETERIRIDASEAYQQKMAAVRRGESAEREIVEGGDVSFRGVKPGNEGVNRPWVAEVGCNGENRSSGHVPNSGHNSLNTFEVAVTMEEGAPHRVSECSLDAQFGWKANGEAPSSGAAATANAAFLQALAKQKPTNGSVSQSATSYGTTELEMEEMEV